MSEGISITITPTASAELKKAIANYNRGLKPEDAEYGDGKSMARAIRLGVRGGGCSGFEYFLGLEYQASTDRDLPAQLIDGIQVVVDRMSAMYLDGVVLDFETSMMKSGFKFTNPNATAHCGCGKSFSA